MITRYLASITILFACYSLMAQPSITIEYNCESATLTRNDPPADVIYYWQGATCGTSTANNNKTFFASSSGTYFLRALLSSSTGSTWINSWLSTDCTAAIVKLNQFPETPPEPILSDRTLSLPAPPANVTYFWQGTSCGNDFSNSDATYPVSVTGEYFVRAFNTMYNCWSVDCNSKNVVIISGINDAMSAPEGISLAPTPAVDQVILYLSKNYKSVDLFFYDVNGKLVLIKKSVTSNQLIDISGLSKGTYIVKFSDGNTDFHQKLMINR
jgi:hypothetical protein